MAASQRSLDLDIVTLRRIYARGTNNSAITYNYALLADGKGGTYWGNVSVGEGNSGGTITSSNAFFSNATFSNATFSNATFSNATFSNATFTTLTANSITTSNAFFSNATFSNATFSNATFSNATFTTLTANSITTTTLSFTNLQIRALNICNIFITDGSTNHNNFPNITSNSGTLRYTPSSNLMGLYFFIRSPLVFNFLPPQTRLAPSPSGFSNLETVLTGNFFVVKNMGSNNNINIYTMSNPSDSLQFVPVIPATSATFFYTGPPQNIWTPM